LKDHWPTPYLSVAEKNKKKPKKGENEKSLSDSETETKASTTTTTVRPIKPDRSTLSPPPSPTGTSLSDTEINEKSLLPSTRPLSSTSTLSDTSRFDDDLYDDDFSASNFRETSLRLEPNINEPRHGHGIRRALGSPFKAMRRKIDELEERWTEREERKEDKKEWREIEKQMKKERKSRTGDSKR
jgi:hypothetical protein